MGLKFIHISALSLSQIDLSFLKFSFYVFRPSNTQTRYQSDKKCHWIFGEGKEKESYPDKSPNLKDDC